MGTQQPKRPQKNMPYELEKGLMTTGSKLQLPDVAVFTFCWGTEHVKKSLRSMRLRWIR